MASIQGAETLLKAYLNGGESGVAAIEMFGDKVNLIRYDSPEQAERVSTRRLNEFHTQYLADWGVKAKKDELAYFIVKDGQLVTTISR